MWKVLRISHSQVLNQTESTIWFRIFPRFCQNSPFASVCEITARVSRWEKHSSDDVSHRFQHGKNRQWMICDISQTYRTTWMPKNACDAKLRCVSCPIRAARRVWKSLVPGASLLVLHVTCWETLLSSWCLALRVPRLVQLRTGRHPFPYYGVLKIKRGHYIIVRLFLSIFFPVQGVQWTDHPCKVHLQDAGGMGDSSHLPSWFLRFGHDESQISGRRALSSFYA